MKNKFDWKSFNTHFLLIVLIIANMSIWIFLVIPAIFQNQTQFSIYKEECRNESAIVGYELIEQVIIHHEKNIRLKPSDYLGSFEETSELKNLYFSYNWDCSEYKTWQEGDIFKSVKIKDVQCSKNYSAEEIGLSIYLQQYETAYLLPRTYYQISRDKIPYGKEVILVFDEVLFSKKHIYETQQICENKSVEEIEICKIYKDECRVMIPEYEPIVEINGTMYINPEGIGWDEKCIEKKYCENIQKSDLTEKWLDENCECESYVDCSKKILGENIRGIKGHCSCEDRRGTIGLWCDSEGWDNVKCQTYKCQEYFVEKT